MVKISICAQGGSSDGSLLISRTMDKTDSKGNLLASWANSGTERIDIASW